MKHVIIVIDTSYSMRQYVPKIIKGLNNLLCNLRMQIQDVYLSVYTFSDIIKCIRKTDSVKNIELFSDKDFVYFGTTRLYDTIISVINDFASERNCTHDMYIITDGDDNHSDKSEEDAKKICKQALDTGIWKITHCHTDISKLGVNFVHYKENNIISLLENLSI